MTSPVPTARGTVTARRIPAARHNDHCSGRLPTPRLARPGALERAGELGEEQHPVVGEGNPPTQFRWAPPTGPAGRSTRSSAGRCEQTDVWGTIWGTN